MRNLPIVNSRAVATAPIHTSRQVSFTSGRNLKIIAKRSVTTPKETRKVRTSIRTFAPGSRPVAQAPTADTAAETTSEMSSRKPIPRIMPKETRRVMMKLRNPWPGLASTSQILLRESWSCTKTPVAPDRMVTKPITVASTPEPCLPALAIMDWMASPPCGPTSPRSSPTSWPWTASRP